MKTNVIPNGIPADKYVNRLVTDFYSEDYKVKANGLPCVVYACRVSAIPFNIWWKGRQRPVDQSELASTVSFEADGAVTLEIECAREFKKVVLRPLSKNVTPKVSGKTVTLCLEKRGQYVLELDGEHFALHIFFNPVNAFPEKKKATYNFGAGVHFPGLIRLKSGESVYLDKDAVVYGSIFGEKADNVKIFGYGVLDGSYEERLTGDCYGDSAKGNVKFYESENICIEGVTLRNSAIWCVNFFGCYNIEVDNIKVVGQWRYNTDGIDIVNSQNVTVKNSFVRSFDDTIVLKGIDKYAHIDVKNIRTENCVLWCSWGRTLEIGFETACREYTDIVFENCDLIHNGAVALSIHHGDYALLHNVIYKNIRVEFQKDALPEILQESYDQVYDAKGRVGSPKLIDFTNYRFRAAWIDLCEPGTFLPMKEYEKLRGADGKVATIRDITLDGVYAFAEDGAPKPPVVLDSTQVKGGIMENISFKNLCLNGKKLKKEDFIINGEVKNIKFDI